MEYFNMEYDTLFATLIPLSDLYLYVFPSLMIAALCRLQVREANIYIWLTFPSSLSSVISHLPL